MKTLLLSIMVFLFYISGSPQVVITDYTETQNRITLKLNLELFGKEELQVFYNESRPGEFAIPKRNIILGIPYSNLLRIENEIIDSEKYRFIPNINPEVSVKDSVVIYDHSRKLLRNIYSDIIEVNGFLWIGSTYCISLDINQCIYDYVLREITEIKELLLTIHLRDIIEKNSNKETDIRNRDFILNYDNAVSYQLIEMQEDKIGIDWIDYNKEYIRVKTAADGIYRITYDDLADYNIISSNPSSVNLYCRGQKVPVYIYNSDSSVFNPGDYIEFFGEKNSGGRHREVSVYGEPYNEYKNLYSDTAVYWLTWNDTDPERVTVIEDSNSCSQDTLEYFTEILHLEKDNWFDYSTDLLIRRELPFWIENKTWGWHSIGVGSSVINFEIKDLVPAKKVSIYCKLQSYASSIQQNSHHLGISINDGGNIDLGFLNKYEQKVYCVNINSDSLLNGSNKVRLHSYQTSSAINTLFLDWYEIEYPRALKLVNDSLLFRFNYLTAPVYSAVNVDNAFQDKYCIWKKGTIYKKFLTDVSNNSLSFTDTMHFEDQYAVIHEDKCSRPLLSPSKRFSNLSDISRSADYILITNNTFAEAGYHYINFIEQYYNIKALLIDIDDIFDEFSFGFFNPEAIKDFLYYTYRFWQKPAPEFVFLVGDGTYDYHRNKEINLGSPGVNNIVPSFGAPVSDNWFVTWDTTGAYLPMMNIGRLPVNNPEDLYNYLNKHKNYLNNSLDAWNKKYLFFSGGIGNNQNELTQLKNVNDFILKNYVEQVPVGGRGVHLYKTLNPQTNFGPYSSEEINNAIDSSGIFISYLGHSGTQTWDNGIVDPGQLSNKLKKYPLITDFGCSTGKFAEPDVTSFSEMFINDGGAIAYIGNSSLGFFSTSTSYPLLFYKRILQDSVYRISKAHRLAKLDLLKKFGTSGVYSLFSLTNTYFGDPIINLPVPGKPDLHIDQNSIKPSEPFINDRIDTALITVNIYNLGSVTSDSLSVFIRDIYHQEAVYERLLKFQLPLFSHSLTISLPVKNRSGEHSLYVELDPENRIDEINEMNNKSTSVVNVYNSDLRLLHDYQNEGAGSGQVEFLLPVYSGNKKKYVIEYSNDKFYQDINSVTGILKEFSDVLYLPADTNKKRFWIRGRFEGEDALSFARSFTINSDNTCLFNDSISFSSLYTENIGITNNQITIDTSETFFSVISAGFHDGKTTVISRDGQTYVPGGNTIGHHVCLFKEDTHEFIAYKRFNVFGETLAAGEYYRFLDTLSSDYLVLIGVNDEGRLPDSLRRKLHEFGSIYIDSLRFRSSWALLGRRGIIRGSVPEAFTHPFEGKAVIDTVIKKPSPYGRFITHFIGPSAKWEHLHIISSSSDTSIINLNITAFSRDKMLDTTFSFYTGESETPLDFIEAERFPYIKVTGELKDSPGGTPPSIEEFGVKYKLLPELVISDRSTSLSKDTLAAGEVLEFSTGIYNAGETNSGTFNASAVVRGDNFIDTVLNITAGPVEPKEIYYLSRELRTTRAGSYYLDLNIDSGNDVREIYEDNNTLSIPFYIKKDETAPTLDITSDGISLYDGCWLSEGAEIKITAMDLSYQNDGDTTMLKISINGKEISPQDITFSYKDQDKISAVFIPVIKEGEHILRVTAHDKEGNSTHEELSFMIAGETRLLSVWNYPNPFSSGTWFTFILTGVPDEISINIYTIAGRLIKNIKAVATELRTDFNRIYWDGRDDDGDKIANGVYFYKMKMRAREKLYSVTGKMAAVNSGN